MAHLKLTPELIDVIDRSTIEGNALFLPGTLDRKIYQKVNVAIEAAGGKWNRKAKAHLFDVPPREALGLVVAAGVVIDTKKERQAFYTPSHIADRLAKIADVRGHRVLEPSAGNGALADACIRGGASMVSVIEMDPEECINLKAKGYVGLEGDFLTARPRPIFSRIVMNPPFAKNQDVKHLSRALQWLAPQGVIVCILPDRFRDKSLRSLIDLPHGYELEEFPLPPKTFSESGTNVNTIIAKISAN